jgi:hypothetical protein
VGKINLDENMDLGDFDLEVNIYIVRMTVLEVKSELKTT